MENNPDDKDDDPIPQTPCSPPAPTTPFTPFPKEYPNEAAGTEAFFRMFPRRYDGDTAFFVGSLQDACKAAFSWKAVEDRRPVLVYLHHKAVRAAYYSNDFVTFDIFWKTQGHISLQGQKRSQNYRIRHRND
ncbi:unnamed protein product, partial [Rotaria sp. Silwood1]